MKLLFALLFSSLAFGQTITLTDSDILAFPTAHGEGNSATGGQGGTIVEVTNLNKTGTGSLAAALDQTGARTIVFRVGGTIDMSPDGILRIDAGEGDVTIAGETAPGGGITIINGGMEIKDSNVIMRYITIRPGAATTNRDALRIINTSDNINLQNIIIDHCSLTWATDENIGMANNNSPVKSINQTTIQYCILAESFGGKNLLFDDHVWGVSAYKNYFANSLERSIRSGGCTAVFEKINNIVYNWRSADVWGYGTTADAVGNIYKTGSEDNITNGIRIIASTSEPNCEAAVASDCNVHQSDNVVINIAGGFALTSSIFDANDSPTRQFPTSKITPDVISNNAGAELVSELFASNGVGNSLGRRDAIDTRLIANYSANTGAWITNESSVEGFITIAGGTAYTDTDSDGLSDAYETANGGTVTATTRPATAVISDGTTIDQSGVTSYATLGYTHLDIFLADLAGDWDNFEVIPPSNDEGVRITPATRVGIGAGIGGIIIGGL